MLIFFCSTVNCSKYTRTHSFRELKYPYFGDIIVLALLIVFGRLILSLAHAEPKCQISRECIDTEAAFMKKLFSEPSAALNAFNMTYNEDEIGFVIKLYSYWNRFNSEYPRATIRLSLSRRCN